MIWSLLFAASALVAPPPSVPAIDFTMADQAYRMPMPGGYCRPHVIPAAARGEATGSNGDVIAKPIYLQLCNERGISLGDQDFIYFKYLKSRQVDFTDRRDFITSNAPAMQDEAFIKWLESDEVLGRAEDKTEQQTGAKIQLDAQAQPLGHDDTCIYNGARLTAVSAKPKSKDTILVVTCITMIDRNLVMIDIASHSKRGLGYPVLAKNSTHWSIQLW